jgi:uncharacterized membrane protein
VHFFALTPSPSPTGWERGVGANGCSPLLFSPSPARRERGKRGEGDEAYLPNGTRTGYNQFLMAIRVRLGQDEVQVEPGGSAQLLAVVRNEGDAPDQVALEVEGVDAEWCAIPIPSFSLAPGEEVQERILIRPPRSTESRAGTYPILVRARSLENGGSGVAQASITIRPYSMLTLEIAPKRGIVSPLRKRVPYELTLANYGNTEQTVQLHVSDPEDEVVFELERERVLLAPGETQSVLVYAQPRRIPTLANPALFSFTATARSVEDPLRSTSVRCWRCCLRCGHIRARCPWR